MRPVGSTIGHYRLGEVLGKGGMGVVQRAQDLTLGRAVAIKFLSADNPEARARFLREARAASALDHPNIGTVYEIDEADGTPFIVMALYEGETLRARLQRAPLSVEEAVAIAKQLCLALAAAHQAGVVHRDLKPANIMLLADGTVKLLDFGLAKLTSIDETVTRDGTLLGTLVYMAPEQLKSGAIDARTDLWALGAVLYEMLAGRPPFGSGPAETVVAGILEGKPAPLEAPEDLRTLTLRLLSRDSSRRLASAAAVGELLSRRAGPPDSRGVLVGGGIVLAAGLLGLVLSLPAPEAPESLAQPASLSMYERGTRSYNLGRFAQAASEFLGAFEVSGDSELLFNVAQSLRLAGNRNRALQFYQRFAATLPKDSQLGVEVDQRIAELSGPDPSPPNTTRELEAAYQATGEPELLLKLGERYLQLGDKEKARHHFMIYLRSGGADPAAARHLAELQPSPSP